MWLALLVASLLPASIWGSRLRNLHHAARSEATNLHDSVPSTRPDYTIKLDNHENVQYTAPFTLGDQTLPVIYDTGSFEVLVLSAECKTCSSTLEMYDRMKSGTYKAGDGLTVEHCFGSGCTSGEGGFETVRIGSKDSPFYAKDFPFWQVIRHKIAAWNNRAHFSGIVGLGPSDRVPEGFGAKDISETTLLARMKVESFGFCLQRDSPFAPGLLRVGPSLDAMVEKDPSFQSVPVMGKTHWSLKMTNLRLPGVDGVENLCAPSCAAIVDSGTSLLSVPRSALESMAPLLSMIKSDCSNLNSLPTLRFQLGGLDIELPPHAYVMRVQLPNSGEGSWPELVDKEAGSNSHRCSPAFMTVDKETSMGPLWILGMPFFRYYYSVFSRQSKKIYLAQASPSCGLSESSFQGVGLFNASSSGMRAFSSADYQPMEVDLNQARVADWAFEQGDQMLTL
eukprot:gnl/TRDRNA2_/TRDRNA2_191812_c0_seq1.p1 gnl/TRDRNA2_/TRDRNA2_191812_c0~~gnl/TRDRNA2_/TRDRNA2_191812_c0_seq1.p1  ORF type:complete len:451 (+),score=72.95 gnl/TRDRNA2_/TRDRNA2_191812_c0_seq1:102-1454(+)